MLFIALTLVFATYCLAETQPIVQPSSVWIILFLLGVIQILVGYVYVSGMNDIKTSIKEIKNDLKDDIEKLDNEKLDRKVHEQMCPIDKPK